jgi:hypothetical protein
LIQEGDRVQKEGVAILDNIVRHIVVMDDKANLIAVELDRQINKLDQIYDEMNETETTLKR